MNAKEAREISEANKYSSIKEEFHKIVNTIEIYASQGHTAIRLNRYLRGAIVNKLEEEGYKVEAFDNQREGQWTSIFW